MAADLIADTDRMVLVEEIIRRIGMVRVLHRVKMKRDLDPPASIKSAIDATQNVHARFVKAYRNRQPAFYSRNEYDAISALAVWLVDTFHALRETKDPPDVSIFKVCFEDLGAKTLHDTGLIG